MRMEANPVMICNLDCSFVPLLDTGLYFKIDNPKNFVQKS